MLRGTLDDFSLPDVFRLVSLARKTGRLDVERKAGDGRVYFREGEVYYAESSLSREPLGQKLIRAGALTEGQLRKALDEHSESGNRVGDILVQSGIVSVEQIQTAVEQQIEDSIFDLLRWELGEFEWTPGFEVDVEIPIGVSVENLIMEASRRLDELEIIQRKIPSMAAILAMAPKPPEGALEINITPEEWRVLVLVDGSRSVADVAAMVGLDDFQAMRMMYGLVSSGLVEVADPGTELEEAIVAEPAGEWEEAEAPVAAVAEEAAEPEPEAEVSEPEAVAPEMAEPDVTEVPASEAEMVEELEPVEAEPAEALEEPAVPVEAVEELEPVAEAEPELVPEAAEPAEAEQTEEEIVLGEAEPVALEEAAEAEAEPGLDEFQPTALDEQALADELMPALDDAEVEPVAVADAETPDVTEGAPPEEWFQDPEVGVEAFDAPGPDELVTEVPERAEELVADGELEPIGEATPAESGTPDSFLGDLFEGETASPPAPEPAAPTVDRAAVVRELAGLFSDEEIRPRTRASKDAGPAGDAKPDDARKRVEDDDQVTKGLISRLIDGVKGL